MKTDIILIGGGGHCKACIDVIEQTRQFHIAGIIDRRGRIGEHVLGYPIVAADDDLPVLVRNNCLFLVTIGQIKSPEKRTQIYESIREADGKFATVVSPLAYVSPHARIGEGTIVMHHALVNAGATIADNCIINSKALIEHDAVIADHCHISTGARVNGGVQIDEGVFFGSGAVARESVNIGKRAFIGANQTITENVRANQVVT
ncbi:4-amino-6-deoxy-N-Acetyl-D-hexosaminyl-(Lipid carrier) acetyltrasferase [Olavius algarvensis associated proteobacterium Delta 3]|nr:4-amino-6-deoxy-N-Acetyl-D-hexosaminyl-(Lipid carrier) acetyltrasferase [Olavius algarvensis associated proteobacterium Delta 3]CAB5114321.1 4-amino-6-deoxy-N-Acetyl-D-hexosaminyl-(Lipid carrier) acetyltrasferase [Olavius algarvensis associated proteobacterium Delta 3]